MVKFNENCLLINSLAVLSNMFWTYCFSSHNPSQNLSKLPHTLFSMTFSKASLIYYIDNFITLLLMFTDSSNVIWMFNSRILAQYLQSFLNVCVKYTEPLWAVNYLHLNTTFYMFCIWNSIWALLSIVGMIAYITFLCIVDTTKHWLGIALFIMLCKTFIK